MSSSASLILVTGISGFLGAHVAHQLLQDPRYRVRGVSRSSKVSLLQSRYARYGDKFEAAGVDDLVAGDFSAALQGVDAVIHLAAPLIGKEATAERAIEIAVEGSLNILRQSEAAGIKNFVYMSSIVAVTDLRSRIPAGGKLDNDEWNKIKKEDALKPDALPFTIYTAEKTLAERAVWEFGERHAHVEVATLNPPFFFGPFAPEYDIPDGNLSALSTDSMMYDLLHRDGPVPRTPAWVDVRDVARAVIAALRAPPTSQVGRKRFVMAGEEWFSPREAVQYIAGARPELKDRLSEVWNAIDKVPESILDVNRAKEVLEIQLTPWRDTVLASVDAIIALENEWKKNGIVPH